MGLKAIYTTLEKEGISSIDISLAEECIGRNYQLTFQISSEKGILADPISIPQNLPYIFTGKETIPYDKNILGLLEKLSLKSYPELYQDFLTKDTRVI